MDWQIIFALFLYFLAAILIVAEIFVPSGGIISILALVSIAGGLWIFFNNGTAYGIAGIIIAAIMIPTVLVITYKIFPKTSFGRSVILEPPKRQPGDAVPASEKLKTMIGKQGVTLCELRPIGTCMIDDEKYECVAENTYIQNNQPVSVIGVDGSKLKVRIIDQNNERA